MDSLTEKLDELMKMATNPADSAASFCEVGESNQKLSLFLRDNAHAIRDLVRAVSDEHGGNHHEPECPICIAISNFKDDGEK